MEKEEIERIQEKLKPLDIKIRTESKKTKVREAIERLIGSYNIQGEKRGQEYFLKFYKEKKEVIISEWDKASTKNYKTKQIERKFFDVEHIEYGLDCLNRFYAIVSKNHLESLSGKEIIARYGDRIFKQKDTNNKAGQMPNNSDDGR